MNPEPYNPGIYHDAGLLALGLVLGGMGVFSFMVAPLAFRILPEAMAGKFVRGLFPWYYLFVIVAALLAVIGSVGHGPVASKLMAAVFLLAVFARQWLMPRINALRDRQLAGDAGAGAWFGRAHGLSVAINFVQLGLTLAAVIVYV
jgi:hypothetical protein